MVGAKEGAAQKTLILRSALRARLEGWPRATTASWFETHGFAALLTTRVYYQATWPWVSSTYSVSASQTTRLRPARLAA